MSDASGDARTADRSVVTAWILLAVLLAGLAGLFRWTFVHVVGRPSVPTVGAYPIDGAPDVSRIRVGDDPSLVSRAGGEVADGVPLAPVSSGVEVTESASGADPDTETEIAAVSGSESGAEETGDSSTREVPDAGVATTRSSADEDLDALRRLLAEAAEVADEETAGASGSAAGGAADAADAPEPATATALADLSSDVRFAYRGTTFVAGASAALDELAALLTARPDTVASVVVRGNEHRDATRDRVLARERGRTVIAALVERGMDFERLSVDARRDDDLPPGTHRVSVVVDTDL